MDVSNLISDEMAGFALIGILVILAAYVLHRIYRAKHPGTKKSTPSSIEGCREDVERITDSLDQQACHAKAWSEMLATQGEPGYARFFKLVSDGNVSQIERLCDAFGYKVPTFHVKCAEGESSTLSDVLAVFEENNAKMREDGMSVKSFLRKARKFKAHHRMVEFEDFLETREKALSDVRKLPEKSDSTMKLCRICGSIFVQDVPGFCLGCAALNNEFVTYGPKC